MTAEAAAGPLWRSLEVAAETGDPADAIYAALFSRSPQFTALFVNDASGRVRGHMLRMAFDCALDLAGEGDGTGLLLLESEIINHGNLGVPAGSFSDFFGVIRDVLKAQSGAAWTSAMDEAWQSAVCQAEALSRAAA